MTKADISRKPSGLSAVVLNSFYIVVLHVGYSVVETSYFPEIRDVQINVILLTRRFIAKNSSTFERVKFQYENK
jgi:hypothetical protein